MHENGWFSKIYGEMEPMSSKGMQINLGGKFQGLMTGTKIISSHYPLKLSTQSKGIISWLVLIILLDFSIVLIPIVHLKRLTQAAIMTRMTGLHQNLKMRVS